jgi:hypothetical protein
MKKLKVATVRRYSKKDDTPASSDELVIAIPLKGGQGVRNFPSAIL